MNIPSSSSPDMRNITDDLKGKSHEEIKAILQTRRKPFSVLLCNLQYDLNTGNIVRTANAFSASRIIVYGRKKYDKRGAVGTYLYENITFVRTEEELINLIKSEILIAIDNTPTCSSISHFIWPPNPCLVFGHEAEGIAPEVMRYCVGAVGIPQTGSVRSMNVATAAGIAMYDLAVKNLWV